MRTPRKPIGSLQERRCRICQHEKRAEIDALIFEGRLPRRQIAARYGLSNSGIHSHATRHLARAMMEAVAEMTITDAKSLLSTASDRAETYHRIFKEDPRKNKEMGKLALDHETAILKATGSWRERFDLDLTLRPGDKLPPADQADADFLKIVDDPETEKLFPGFRDWYSARVGAMLAAELEEKKKEGDPPPLRMITADDSD